MASGQRRQKSRPGSLEPARKFAGTSLGSRWTLLERFIETGQELPRKTARFFSEASQELVEQASRGQGEARVLVQGTINPYMGFLDSIFFCCWENVGMYQEPSEATNDRN
jgi:hypothetical protein